MNVITKTFSGFWQNVRGRVRREGNRKLVQEKTEVTHLQRLGFLLIAIGLFFLLYDMFLRSHIADTTAPSNASAAPTMAVLFFIIMLGVAFAFPSLLRGNEGISTMRIVVFMMANVICMLLIKFGWENNNLKDIGMNEWWMGVIAFVFGAKATQSFFESRMAVPQQENGGAGNTEGKTGMSGIAYSHADVARFAVTQNEQNLKTLFPNIASVSDAVDDLNKPDSHVVALYLKDSNVDRIPSQLEAKMPDGSVRTIATEIITDGGEAKPHFSQRDTIADVRDADYIGSICCAVQSVNNSSIKGVVTSAHIFTRGNYSTDNNAVLSANLQRNVLIGGKAQAKWFYKQMLPNQDLIVAKLNDDISEDDITHLIRFENRYHELTDADVQNRLQVTVSAQGGKQTVAYVLDRNINYPFKYANDTFFKTNVILIGNNKNRKSSQPVSTGGDSGSPVFVTIGNEKHLIGILLGSNQKFTFVLPVKDTLSDVFNLI